MTNHAGTIINILNLPFIKYQWNKIRKELIDNYGTETTFLSTLETIDKIVSTNESVAEYLALPSVYGLFFNGNWCEQLVGIEQQLTKTGVEAEEVAFIGLTYI